MEKLKKTKILCVIGQLGDGGSEKQLFLFLKHLDRKLFSPLVLVASSYIIDKWREAFAKIEVPVDSLGMWLSAAKLPAFKLRLLRGKPDIIFSWSFYTNAFHSLSGDIPFLGSLRGGIEEERSELSSLHFKLSLRPKRVVVNSMELSRELHSERAETKIEVIRNIFEDSFASGTITKEARLNAKITLLRQTGFPENSILISGGGRDSASKDFHFWLDIFEKMAVTDSRIRGMMFGEGPPAIIADEIKRRDLSDKIVLLGALPNLRELFSGVDLFLLSSLREGLPNVLLEAIDSECLIASTRVGGVENVFQKVPPELKKLMLIDKRNANLAAENILTLLSDEDALKRSKQHTRPFLEELRPNRIMPLYNAAIERTIKSDT